ncbi:MAG: ATP-binding cassette domain-containing protein [Candidatus Bathyarchaeia archaeon]
MRSELLRLESVSKTYGNTRALQNVNFTVCEQECVGLVGDNGAGKSTLVKIISGAVQPDQGLIYWRGKQVLISSPAIARALGIEMVYQDLALCDSLTVAHNIFLGREPVRRLGFLSLVNRKLLLSQANKVLSDLRITHVDVTKKVKDLSGGQRQAVALGRAFITAPTLLILDEPTAALAVSQAMRVLEVIRELKRRGISVILISHRLQDILETCDRVYVLYEGRVVAERSVSGLSLEELAKLIARPKEVELSSKHD